MENIQDALKLQLSVMTASHENDGLSDVKMNINDYLCRYALCLLYA